ncbi:MAG TPA: prepilin-type N-terminal cleavage/methylation domain-containing protein [Candidatus Hydrogenedentes bacterium]|nr:prepilin-type N-terminal cleavage/methylation domain-containing protein [Candidatus Hydrogenedentota bacterium]HNT86270.1 prepilin-type N-terminal cleavage/methylation domain-containing protein [Candidatus Hydrogenedentota bacterium]
MYTRNEPIAGARAAERGMSLVEILVAMAIFIVLLAGITLLFSGAIDAVRTGYVNQEAFERARSSMTQLERDLAGAFTAREFGDYYAFYGGPKGFSFVGVVEGRLARVTYVAHPTVDSIRYQSSYTESYETLRQRAWDQGGAALQSRFEEVFAGDVRGDIVDIDSVTVVTQSLVRYVEPGRTDLDTFEIKRANGTRLTWPTLDRIEPALDRYDSGDSDNLRLYLGMLDGVNPRVLPFDALPADSESLAGVLQNVRDSEDMRRIMQQEAYASLRALSHDDVNGIIQAKRRELWIRMLAGEPGLPAFWGDPRNPSDPRPKAEHYVLAENILFGIYDPRLPEFDLSGSPPLFTYWITVNKEPKPPHFNDVRLIPGYTAFVFNPDVGSLYGIDDGLVTALSAQTPSLVFEGMPLAPRLPGFIGAGFWVATPSRWVNSKDFLRWFAMEIQVPAAAGRDMQSVLTRRERL